MFNLSFVSKVFLFSGLSLGFFVVRPAYSLCIAPGNCVIDLNGVHYSINFQNASSASNPFLLSSQPWFGSLTNATNAATQVNNALGTPNTFGGLPPGPAGPYFAYTLGFPSIVFFNGTSNSIQQGTAHQNAIESYAVATSVPLEHDALPFIVSSAFLGLVGWWKHRHTKNSV